MKRYWLLSLIIICGIFATGCSSPRPFARKPQNYDQVPLSLTLKLDKSVYKPGESIKASVSLRSENLALVNARMAMSYSAPVEGEIKFVIMTPSEKEAGWLSKIRIYSPEDNDFMYLYPNHSLQAEYNLGMKYLFGLDQIGRYTVYAIYANRFDPQNGLYAWKGEIKSSLIEFEIK